MQTNGWAPRCSPRTTPATLANKVSSPPRPTFFPGLKRVPRCRTRMLPPVTVWPENAFIPRRRPALSRPLRELPTPFLCAMIPSGRGGGPLRHDLRDPDLGQLLPVTCLAAILFPLLELENVDFLAARLRQDLRHPPRSRHGGMTDSDGAAIRDQEAPVQPHPAALLPRQPLQSQDLARLHPVLLSSRFDDRLPPHSFP